MDLSIRHRGTSQFYHNAPFCALHSRAVLFSAADFSAIERLVPIMEDRIETIGEEERSLFRYFLVSAVESNLINVRTFPEV